VLKVLIYLQVWKKMTIFAVGLEASTVISAAVQKTYKVNEMLKVRKYLHITYFIITFASQKK